MIRRILLGACATFFLLAAPAAADHDYGHVGAADVERVPVVVDTDLGDVAETDTLAQTGSSNLVPMVEASIVLIGGGSLLLLVARRRRADRQPVAA